MLQGRRNGFLDWQPMQKYDDPDQQMHDLKLQQERHEMSMKPWERDIDQLERFYQKSQEEKNIQLNSGNS